MPVDKTQMKYVKNMMVQIDIKNPVEFFSREAPVKSELAKIYEKKCYNNCFINKIIRIIEETDPIVNSHSNNTHCTLGVTFECEVIEYLPGEIVAGLVINDNKEILICSSKHIACILSAKGAFSSLEVGMYCIIVVKNCNYRIDSSKIQITGEPYTLMNKDAIFEIPEIVSPSTQKILDQIQAEKNSDDGAEKIKSNDYITLKNLFRKNRPQGETGAADSESMANVIGPGAIGPMKVRKFDDLTAEKGVPATGENDEVNMSYDEYLIYYLSYLVMLKTCMETITGENMKKNEKLFSIYKKIKNSSE